jgi:hypothetical protein
MVSLITRKIIGAYFIVAIMIITHLAGGVDSCSRVHLWDGSLEVTVPGTRILFILDISRVPTYTDGGEEIDRMGFGQS